MEILKQLPDVPAQDVKQCRERVQNWFADTAPLIQWDVISTPIGTLHIAINASGICEIKYTDDLNVFLGVLDPIARTEHNPAALANITHQLTEYFDGNRAEFDVSIDEQVLTGFQKRVFQIVSAIPAGVVWTYGQVAKAINKPNASRAVGRALSTNPIPIIIPCHRVVGHDGKLTGYAGGIERKRHLLQLEGAI